MVGRTRRPRRPRPAVAVAVAALFLWAAMALLVVLLLPPVSDGAPATVNWAPTRLVTVSPDGDAWLFRGPAPVVNTTGGDQEFEASQLLSNLMRASKNSTSPLPGSALDLRLVSLLNPETINEAPVIKTEEAYVAGHASNTSFNLWVIEGDSLSPANLSSAAVAALARNLTSWQKDRLVNRTATIQAWLDGAGNALGGGPRSAGEEAGARAVGSAAPLVIYTTDEDGYDRVGELTGAWLMRYTNASLSEVVAWNAAIKGSAARPEPANALAWFCYWLRYGQDYDVDCSLQ